MPRGVALNLWASALTILSAMALVCSALLVNQGSIAAPLPSNSSQVAEAFYAAVNEALESGNLSPLDAVIAPDIIVHGLPAGHSADGAGLRQYLTTLREVMPDVRLQVDRMTAAGDTAISQVASHAGNGVFAGLRIADRSASWRSHDTIRVAKGRVAELWRGRDEPVWLLPLTRETFDPLADVRFALLERLESPAGNAWEDGPFFDLRVVFVIDGSMSVRVDAASGVVAIPARWPDGAHPAGASRVGITTLEAGEALAIPAGARYVFAGSGVASDVTAYSLTLPTFAYEGPLILNSHATSSDDATARSLDHFSRTPLATTRFPAVASGPLTASLGRVILQPGASVRFHGSNGLLFLIPESGAPVLANPDHSLTGSHLPAMGRGEAMLDREGAQVITPGQPFSLFNFGDVASEMLIVTVIPQAEAAIGAPA